MQTLTKNLLLPALAGIVYFAAAPGLFGATSMVFNDLENGSCTGGVLICGSTTLSNSTVTVVQESISVLGSIDIHGDFVSTDPNRPSAGSVITYNVNFLETGDGVFGAISDTLQITLTGRSPSAGNPDNVSVDATFLTDTEGANGNEIVPTALPGALSVYENGGFQTFVPLTDLIVSAGSDGAPEPGTLSLLGLGLTALGFGYRRHRSMAKTS